MPETHSQTPVGPNWRKQALLAGVLFVLGTGAYWLEFRHRPDREAKEEQAKKLFVLADAKDADRQTKVIELSGETASFRFECEAESLAAKICKPGESPKWKVTQAGRAHGSDETNVNALVSALNNLVVEETISLKDETAERRTALLAEYGLSPEARAKAPRVVVETSAGRVVAYLGGAHPMTENLFTLLERDGKADETQVLLTPSFFKANFDHDLAYWRDKRMVALKLADVTGFELSSGGARISGEKTGAEWALSVPGRAAKLAGDFENIDSLISSASFLTAKGFAHEDKDAPAARAELARTKATVTLTLRKGPTERVEIAFHPAKAKDAPPAAPGQAKPEVTPFRLIATVSTAEPVFELDPASLSRFTKGVKDLRLSKLLASIDRFATTRIEASGPALGSPPVVVALKNGKWEADGKPVVADRASKLLDGISGNRIQEFLPSAPGAGGDAGVTLELKNDQGETKRRIRFWDEPGKGKAGRLFARDVTAGAKPAESFAVDASIRTVLPDSRDFFTRPAPSPTAPPAAAPLADPHAH